MLGECAVLFSFVTFTEINPASAPTVDERRRDCDGVKVNGAFTCTYTAAK